MWGREAIVLVFTALWLRTICSTGVPSFAWNRLTSIWVVEWLYLIVRVLNCLKVLELKKLHWKWYGGAVDLWLSVIVSHLVRVMPNLFKSSKLTAITDIIWCLCLCWATSLMSMTTVGYFYNSTSACIGHSKAIKKLGSKQGSWPLPKLDWENNSIPNQQLLSSFNTFLLTHRSINSKPLRECLTLAWIKQHETS